jgi:hypothetical protein
LGIAAPTAASIEAAEKKKAANREAAEKRKALELERQLERDKLRAQQQQMADLKEQEWLEGNGPQIQMPTFEVPGDGTSWASDEETPEVTFKNMPTLASLVGSYDLIFYYNAGDEEGIPKNRATKGSLDFTIDATGELHGIVALHKSVKNASWDHRYDAKITCKSDEEQEQDKAVGAFEVTNIEELENLCYEDVQGTIQRVATRQAVRYMPECEDDDVEDYQLDYGESIQFGNAQEAQLILDKYHQEPFLWLCSHSDSLPQFAIVPGSHDLIRTNTQATKRTVATRRPWRRCPLSQQNNIFSKQCSRRREFHLFRCFLHSKQE